MRLPQVFQRLLQGDMPVEIVGPMAAQALKPLPLDPPLHPLDDFDRFTGLGRERIRKIDSAEEAERHKPGALTAPAPNYRAMVTVACILLWL